jgi:hypothetical protein
MFVRPRGATPLPSPRRVASIALALGALLALAGCEEEKKASTSSADAGVDAGRSSIDPKLAAAVAAAAATATAKADAGPDNGPPESGIFGPGGADAAHPKGTPAKIELLGEGSEPRAALKLDLASDAEQKATVAVGVRLGAQSAMPNIDFALSIKADKPRADKPKTDKKAPEVKAPELPAGSHAMIAKVADATLSAKQPGALPKELGDQVKKLKGSQIRFALSENGAGTSYTVELAKGADPSLDAPLQAAVEAMSILTVPLPSKPVGVGAYWITTDRSDSFGIDVVRYRVFRVEKIDKNDVTLSVECRQWAADTRISLALGADKTDLSVQQFESQGKGQVLLAGAPFISNSGDIKQTTHAVALIARGGQQPQPVPIQTELTGKVVSEKPAAPKEP